MTIRRRGCGGQGGRPGFRGAGRAGGRYSVLAVAAVLGFVGFWVDPCEAVSRLATPAEGQVPTRFYVARDIAADPTALVTFKVRHSKGHDAMARGLVDCDFTADAPNRLRFRIDALPIEDDAFDVRMITQGHEGPFRKTASFEGRLGDVIADGSAQLERIDRRGSCTTRSLQWHADQVSRAEYLEAVARPPQADLVSPQLVDSQG